MQLSNHFSLAEFTRSQTALRSVQRYGPNSKTPDPSKVIDNTPGTLAKKNLQRLVEAVLSPVRKHYGLPVRISSGYRSLALNRAIGSKDTSDHVTGCAVDFEIPGVPNIDVACWIRDNLEYRQVILEFWREDDPYAGWIHVSFREGNNKKQVLTIGVDGTKKGLP